MKVVWAALLGLGLVGCGSSERPHRAATDGGTAPHPTKLPADGGLFVDPDVAVQDLGRDILRDVGRLDTHDRVAADQVTIGGAYEYRFAFEPDEVPEDQGALAIPVTVRAPPADLALGRLTLLDEQGRRIAAEPIVEWLDATGGKIVAPPEPLPTDELRLLLVYFAPKTFRAGALQYGEATLGPVRRGARGPVRPRSSCQIRGAFGYAPIPRQVFVELEVDDGFAAWTPMRTSVAASSGEGPAALCEGYRRLDARGALLDAGTAPPEDVAFPAKARFLAFYQLPEGETPGTLRWDGTDCETSTVPARAPLPTRLGPERGPPRFETGVTAPP